MICIEKEIELVNSVMEDYGVWSHEREAWYKLKNLLTAPKHETVEELYKTIVKQSNVIIGEYGHCFEEGCDFDEIDNPIHDNNCMVKKSIEWLKNHGKPVVEGERMNDSIDKKEKPWIDLNVLDMPRNIMNIDMYEYQRSSIYERSKTISITR